MLKEVFLKDIGKMFELQGIKDQGYLLSNGRLVQIYEITPINLMTNENCVKEKICNAYLAILRGLPNTFQILIMKRKDSLNKDIELYKKRLLEVENYGLKLAIKKYVDYLEELNENNQIYNSKHYLITEYEQSNKELEELFANLREFGFRIIQVTSKNELEKIFRKAIN